MGMGGNSLDIGKRQTRTGYQNEADGNQFLAQDLQGFPRGNGIQRGADAALDGSFDGHHRGICRAVADQFEGAADICRRYAVRRGGPRDLQQGGFGEGALGTQEGIGTAHYLTVGSCPLSDTIGLPASSHAPIPPSTLTAE